MGFYVFDEAPVWTVSVGRRHVQELHCAVDVQKEGLRPRRSDHLGIYRGLLEVIARLGKLSASMIHEKKGCKPQDKPAVVHVTHR